MLRIRPEQLKVLEVDVLRRFKEEMVEHSKEFSPQLCNNLSDKQLHVIIKQSIKRADKYGFTNRGSVRLYLEIKLLLGSNFDTDPQYPKLAEILKRDDEQMQRADALYEVVVDYENQVIGSGAIYKVQALEILSEFVHEKLVFQPNTFVTEMLDKMTQMYSQKVNYIGTDDLTELIIEGQRKAREFRFSTTTNHGEILLILLMFSFGHGCIRDPLYPWISQILYDEKIIDPAIKIKLLEEKVLILLAPVVEKQAIEVQL